MSAAAPSAPLPQIVRFFETLDAPDSQCPHCGATGRFILRFQVADGRQLGAMRGCVKLFPVSRAAREELRLRGKLADYSKRGWQLNRRDSEALAALDAFFAGDVSEAHALGIVAGAKLANSARYRRRR